MDLCVEGTFSSASPGPDPPQDHRTSGPDPDPDPVLDDGSRLRIVHEVAAAGSW